MLCRNLKVESPNVQYTPDFIESKNEYQSTELTVQGETLVATPTTTQYEFRTKRAVPKLGVMLVGWGGNNGSTVTAGILANKHEISWNTKEGVQKPNYFGSLTQSSTVRVGNMNGKEAYVPFASVLQW
jgi:myo-inositol-1-phosphate synthase